MFKRSNLQDWLNRVFYGDREEGPCVRLVLRHIDGKGRSSEANEVMNLNIPHGEHHVTLDEDEVEGLINDIANAADQDALGLGGHNRYKLLAYFKHAARPLTRFTFRITVDSDDEHDSEFTEDASKTGLLGQTMRHQEVTMRTAFGHLSQVMNIMHRNMAMLATHNEKLMEERRENFEMMEDLKSQRHERELMTAEAEIKQEGIRALIEKGNILLPVVVNRIAGKKVLAEGNPELEVMQSFAESLSPQQAAAMMKVMTPEQQVAFSEMMLEAATTGEMRQQEREEKRKALKSTNGTGN